ncbi:hypothetical protein IMZ48_40310, partial [Candidatus Bathyarchaeota archaeon]|nr:hypothetical protein [Candidatus Bathyarchaeota archaeon]
MCRARTAYYPAVPLAAGRSTPQCDAQQVPGHSASTLPAAGASAEDTPQPPHRQEPADPGPAIKSPETPPNLQRHHRVIPTLPRFHVSHGHTTEDTQTMSRLHHAPPFRAEHMGSLLRPQPLLDIREKIRTQGIS